MALKLGTRGSALAMVQAETVAKLLAPVVGEVEIVKISTSGDAGNREKLGAFTGEIQRAILDRQVDLGLHCLKDLPTVTTEGLTLAAHLPREDARDAVVTRRIGWMDLPRRSIIGTGSIRRTAQLAAHRPDCIFTPLVGNVDTRLKKLVDRQYDAIVLAVAGLKRLDLWETYSAGHSEEASAQPLEVHTMLPAPGQGVLVLETRPEDAAKLQSFDHPETRQSSIAERAFLAEFGSGCSVPIAAYATIQQGRLQLEGLVASPDGSRVLRSTKIGDPEDAQNVGIALAHDLSERGAQEILAGAVEAKI